MAKADPSLLTKLMLGLFLCCIAIVVLVSLYADAYRKMTLLHNEIDQLKASQVLLMVPEDQAEHIANWLIKHPEQTQAFIANKGEAKSVYIGPGAVVIPDSNDLSPSAIEAQDKPVQEVIVSENDQGVKVISLPNGGVRVTTRDDKKQ